MELELVLGAFIGAAVGAAITVAIAISLARRSFERRFAEIERATTSVTQPQGTAAERFGDVAPELVTLARSATDAAVRREEVLEWHRPSLGALGTDDISESIRSRIRRAEFEAVTARTAFQRALRRHAGAVPGGLETELKSFCDRLATDDAESSTERKRRLAAELDRLETRVRETLGVGLLE